MTQFIVIVLVEDTFRNSGDILLAGRRIFSTDWA